MQKLPSELVAAFARLAVVERAAETHRQRRAALAASGALLRAAHKVGWTWIELAPLVHLTAAGARRRAKRAPAGQDFGGLDLPRPPGPKPTAVRDQMPPGWIGLGAAATYAGVKPITVDHWRRTGVLPNAVRVGHRWYYERSDLDRVLAAPKYRHHGVDLKWLRAQLSASS